jgi:hypothetical protein
VIRRAAFALLLLGTSEIFAADTTVKFEATEKWEPTAAVPVFKIRQGEKFKLFDGIGGGMKWTPGAKDGNKDFHLSGLVMLSSTTITDKTTNTSDTQNIMAGGFVVGYSWFQIGIGRDLISSEPGSAFHDRSKWFVMLNLAGKITF